MGTLGANQWGKSAVRVSKVIRGDGEDQFLDLEVQVLLTGEVEAAYLDGDNRGVLPTDTMKNTVYGLAQDHLDDDLEGFAAVLAANLVAKEGIDSAEVTIRSRIYSRVSPQGFTGGGSERRVAVVKNHDGDVSVGAGLEGLVVLKTGGSAFFGFPRDDFTVLPEADDRLLATSVTAHWPYETVPDDTAATWERVRSILLDRFFGEPSQSVQHQGWMMGSAVLEAIPEIGSITFQLPNQHHLPFDLGRFGVEDRGVVFHPVSEPYGDIRFTVNR